MTPWRALSDNEVQALEERANDIRKSIIELQVQVGSAHTGGPLGMADLLTALYFRVLKGPKNPGWPDRDRLVLSNGHICAVLYAANGARGLDLHPFRAKKTPCHYKQQDRHWR